MFNGSMVVEAKSFERFVKTIIIVGLAANVAILLLLVSGVLKRPGIVRPDTKAVPPPATLSQLDQRARIGV